MILNSLEVKSQVFTGMKIHDHIAGPLTHKNRIYVSESGEYTLIATGEEVSTEVVNSGMMMLYKTSSFDLIDIISPDSIGFSPQCPIISADDRYVIINGYQGEWTKFTNSYLLKYDIQKQTFVDMVELDSPKVPIRATISQDNYYCYFGNGEVLSLNISTMSINWIVNVSDKYEYGPLDLCYFNDKLYCLVYDYDSGGRIIAFDHKGNYDNSVNFALNKLTPGIIYGMNARFFESQDKVILVGYDDLGEHLNVFDKNFKHRQYVTTQNKYFQCNINNKEHTFTTMNNGITTYDLDNIATPKFEQPILNYSSDYLVTGNYLGQDKAVVLADDFIILSDYSDRKTKLLSIPGKIQNLKRYNNSDDICVCTRYPSYLCKYNPLTGYIDDFTYLVDNTKGKFDISFDDTTLAVLVDDQKNKESDLFKTIKIINTSDYSLRKTLKFEQEISSLQFYENSNQLMITTYSGNIIIYNIDTENIVNKYETNDTISDLLPINKSECTLITYHKDTSEFIKKYESFYFKRYSFLDNSIYQYPEDQYVYSSEPYAALKSLFIDIQDSSLMCLNTHLNVLQNLNLYSKFGNSKFVYMLCSEDYQRGSLAATPDSDFMVVCNFDTKKILLLNIREEKIVGAFDVPDKISKLYHSYLYPIVSKDKKSIFLFAASEIKERSNEFQHVESISKIDIGAVFSGIEETKNDDISSNVLIYPNPTVDMVSFQAEPCLWGNSTISLYDISGKLVYRIDLLLSEHNTIALPNELTTGQYVLEIKSINNRINKIININR